jgi:hypothetical protein
VGEGDGETPVPRSVAGREGRGGSQAASGSSACLGSVWSGYNGAVVGHRLLGGGSPVIEYASVTDTIEKVMVYV